MSHAKAPWRQLVMQVNEVATNESTYAQRANGCINLHPSNSSHQYTNTIITEDTRPIALLTNRPFNTLHQSPLMACRLASPARLLPSWRVTSSVHTRLFATEAKQSDPLRILFCGSDAFSCTSLRALHKEHVRNKALIERLEVMVLPGKKTGRGLKVLGEVPCKNLAEDLGLSIHQRPTFREWDLPSGTNLIVAVSFGLFVPPRILQSAKYGGINVHPSLLPDLRGPAPIHHALLNGNTHTGVSLQTLHPKTFDHGAILSQTPLPGIPIPSDGDLASLTSSLATVGAEMLVQGLRDGVHVPPYSAIEQEVASELRHAPKVQKGDARINWTWTGDEWRRRRQVFGSVWTMGTVAKDGAEKRVIFTEIGVVPSADGMDAMRKVTVQVGGGLDSRLDERTGDCYLPLADGCWVRVGRVLVDGKKEQVAAVGLRPFFG